MAKIKVNSKIGIFVSVPIKETEKALKIIQKYYPSNTFICDYMENIMERKSQKQENVWIRKDDIPELNKLWKTLKE